MFAGLHKGADALNEAIAAFSQEAKLLSDVGAKYLVHLPEQYTDLHTGAALEPAELDPEQWKNLISGTNELGKVIFEEYGVELVSHPHADTHLDTQDRILQFLAETDPRYVNLCLDTGHVAYCDGDNIEIIRQAPERITYVHLKFVDPKVRQRVRDEEALAGRGRPARRDGRTALRRARGPPLLDALTALDREVFTILEQDLYPVAPEFRWASRPAPPATSPAAASAPFAAGPTAPVRHGLGRLQAPVPPGAAALIKNSVNRSNRTRNRDFDQRGTGPDPHPAGDGRAPPPTSGSVQHRRCRRPAHHQVRGDDHLAPVRSAQVQTLDQRRHRVLGQGAGVLRDRGQVDLGQARDGAVVVPDHRDRVRDVDARTGERIDQAEWRAGR